MTGADVVSRVDRPTPPAATPPPRAPTPGRAGVDQRAVAAVELAVDELLRAGPHRGGEELAALEAVARAAARLIAERRPERRGADVDTPLPMAGWWSFAAQMPEVDL